MAGKATSSLILADIWGDTVNMRHLGGAMVIGVVLGASFYIGGLHVIKASHPGMAAGLQNAVALLVGIAGCLLAAVISAKLFPPKRTLSEQAITAEDKERVLEELQLDMEQEAEDLKAAAPDILAEMKELQIDEVFRTSNGKGA